MSQTRTLMTRPAGNDRSPTTATPVVLVVDDNEADRTMTRMILDEVAQCRCELFAAAPAALGRLAALRDASVPTYLIVDLRLPDMDGAEFIEKARQIQHDVPAVLVSGVVLPEQTPQIGVDVLEKPLSYTAYRRIVADLAMRWDLVVQASA